MASKKNNKNSNGTDEGTVTQDTLPAPALPWDNRGENRKRFQKFFQDFKTGIAVGIVLGIGGTILTAYLTNLRGGGGINFIGEREKGDRLKKGRKS